MSENNDYIQLPPLKKDTPSDVVAFMWEYMKVPENSKEKVKNLIQAVHENDVKLDYKAPKLYEVIPKEEIADFEEVMRKTIADIVSEASSIACWVYVQKYVKQKTLDEILQELPVASLGSSTVCVIPAFMKKKSKALDLELTSSSILIETGGKKMKKLLIIYYSWSNGNTERIAKMLQSETDSDILKIDTVVPYSGSYDDVVNQGQNEVQRGYEPEIKPLDINIADYDVIAVGTPTWWYTMAPAVKTFLHQQDFTGKTVVPFMTNGGWPGHVIKDMKAACKGANVVCDMQIQFDSTGGSNLETPQEQINEWIQSVKNLL